MEAVYLSYFRGRSGEKNAFIQVPLVLFSVPVFRDLSDGAKLLYGLMLNRSSLSYRNGWIDDFGRTYIIFTVEDLMTLTGWGRQKAINNIRELDTEEGIGLIRKKRQGQGKPNLFYVMSIEVAVLPDDAEHDQKDAVLYREKEGIRKPDDQRYQIVTPRHPVSVLPDIPKPYGSNIDDSNTENSKKEGVRITIYPSQISGEQTLQPDVMETVKASLAGVKERIEYDALLHDYPFDRDRIDEILSLIVDTLILPDQAEVRIGGVEKPSLLVKSVFRKLDSGHIRYVLDSMNENNRQVGNIRAYLLTSLYNAPMTISNYYQNRVNNALYGFTGRGGDNGRENV